MADMTPQREKWQGTMTDRERFTAQMHYRPFDRCMNVEFGYWKENFHEWEIFRQNGIENNHQAGCFFNFDKMAIIGGNTWISPPFEEKVLNEDGEKKSFNEFLGRDAMGRKVK